MINQTRLALAGKAYRGPVYQATCDQCGATQRLSNRWNDSIALLRSKGWSFDKHQATGAWQHFCPDCRTPALHNIGLRAIILAVIDKHGPRGVWQLAFHTHVRESLIGNELLLMKEDELIVLDVKAGTWSLTDRGQAYLTELREETAKASSTKGAKNREDNPTDFTTENTEPHGKEDKES